MEKEIKISKKQFFKEMVIYFLTCCMFFNTSLPVSFATPQDPVQVGGTAVGGITVGNTTTVDMGSSSRAVINWGGLDTSSSQVLQFLKASGDFAVLNRVTGGSVTQFNGYLKGNQGTILIVNPHGIVFGPTAFIQARNFVASGLNIANQDFMDSIYNFTGGEGAVINKGTIGTINTINTGSAALIGKMVQNIGTITTASGGFVVMAAGDKVYLGQPGSKVIVEADAVASAAQLIGRDEEDNVVYDVTAGNVINDGTISAPAGQVILAAGDIYSVPLHPQLKVNTGTVAVPVYNVADQPVRVETGTGSVEQGGTITANGTNGSVILTAGDQVVLDGGSHTAATGTNGKVITYAYDFGDKAATTYFNKDAVIQVGTGLAAINGNHIYFNGTLNSLPGSTLQIDPVTLTIANVMPDAGPALDTLYKAQVQAYSTAGVNLDLAADNLITVNYMDEILGGSGDISLRNVFDNGGINFLANSSGARTTIHTTAGFETGGGDIFMTAGAGGITAGNLLTDKDPEDKISNPGRIVILTTNGGDIQVGKMLADGGNISEISAISSGDLTVNGSVQSINKVVNKEEKDVGFARICLVAMDNLTVDAKEGTKDGTIKVEAHGKITTTGEIIICAGKDVTISNLGKDGINASSQTSQNSLNTDADAKVTIAAGGNKTASATITINKTGIGNYVVTTNSVGYYIQNDMPNGTIWDIWGSKTG